jgi:hypothetical protein
MLKNKIYGLSIDEVMHIKDIKTLRQNIRNIDEFNKQKKLMPTKKQIIIKKSQGNLPMDISEYTRPIGKLGNLGSNVAYLNLFWEIAIKQNILHHQIFNPENNWIMTGNISEFIEEYNKMPESNNPEPQNHHSSDSFAPPSYKVEPQNHHSSDSFAPPSCKVEPQNHHSSDSFAPPSCKVESLKTMCGIVILLNAWKIQTNDLEMFFRIIDIFKQCRIDDYNATGCVLGAIRNAMVKSHNTLVKNIKTKHSANPH